MSAPVEPRDEIEVTSEMIEAGEWTILEKVGGADLGGSFSAADLAASVYRAMELASGQRTASKCLRASSSLVKIGFVRSADMFGSI